MWSIINTFSPVVYRSQLHKYHPNSLKLFNSTSIRTSRLAFPTFRVRASSTAVIEAMTVCFFSLLCFIGYGFHVNRICPKKFATDFLFLVFGYWNEVSWCFGCETFHLNLRATWDSNLWPSDTNSIKSWLLTHQNML